jgi:hypothetical protein
VFVHEAVGGAETGDACADDDDFFVGVFGAHGVFNDLYLLCIIYYRYCI